MGDNEAIDMDELAEQNPARFEGEETVADTAEEVLADVPCLKDELSVGQQCRVTERVHRSI